VSLPVLHNIETYVNALTTHHRDQCISKWLMLHGCLWFMYLIWSSQH